MRWLRVALAGAVIAEFRCWRRCPRTWRSLDHAKHRGTVQSTGRTYDPKTVDKVTLPLKDNVAWKGSVTSPAGTVPIAGAVRVKLPWPLPKVNIGTWGKRSDVHV